MPLPPINQRDVFTRPEVPIIQRFDRSRESIEYDMRCDAIMSRSVTSYPPTAIEADANRKRMQHLLQSQQLPLSPSPIALIALAVQLSELHLEMSCFWQARSQAALSGTKVAWPRHQVHSRLSTAYSLCRMLPTDLLSPPEYGHSASL